jgi:prepilin-type N-terminal cleavage/methylation domain-containing protein
MTVARPSTRRRGYTIIELLVVMAALLVLGALALPTLFGMKGDTRSKAAADMLRARMNEARAKAMEDGTPYRLAVSGDLKRLRLAPDTFEATGVNPTAGDDATAPTVREDDLPDGVTAQMLLDENEQSMQDQAGWVRVATFLPDGTCREDTVEVEIKEPGTAPFIVKLRGLTGAVSVIRGILEAQR